VIRSHFGSPCSPRGSRAHPPTPNRGKHPMLPGGHRARVPAALWRDPGRGRCPWSSMYRTPCPGPLPRRRSRDTFGGQRPGRDTLHTAVRPQWDFPSPTSSRPTIAHRHHNYCYDRSPKLPPRGPSYRPRSRGSTRSCWSSKLWRMGRRRGHLPPGGVMAIASPQLPSERFHTQSWSPPVGC
jgi:hypothetical protein